MQCAEEIQRLLVEHGAVLVRQRKHLVYHLPDGQMFTLPKTPSDHRTNVNDLAKLRRMLGIKRENNKNPNRKSKPGIDCAQETVFMPVEVRPDWRTQLRQLIKSSDSTQEVIMDENNGNSQSLTLRGKEYAISFETKQRCRAIYECCIEVQTLIVECESGELPKDIRRDIEQFAQKVTAEVDLNFAYARYLQIRAQQSRNHTNSLGK